MNSFKDIFQKFFWTLEAADCSCCSTGVLRNSFFKERLRVAASMDFSGVCGWLLLKTSLLEVFSEELLTSGFVYIALLNCNYMKKSVTVNKKKNKAGERLI